MRKLTFLFALGLMMVFSAKSVSAEKKVYTSYNTSTKTLTYYYDDQWGTTDRPNSEEYVPTSDTERWSTYREQVEKIVVDASMKNAPLTSMRRMFYYLSNATSLTGMSNLKTTDVTSMEEMFFMLNKVTSLSLSSDFTTAKVTNMSKMFYGCNKLTSLNLSYFNTANVTNMYYMFYNCNSLTTLNLDRFNTANVTNMSDMFAACSALTSLDLMRFRFDKVTNANYMFRGCKNLETIYCSTDLSTTSIDDYDMFRNCEKLKGGYGTVYSASNVNKTYARPDGGSSSSNPGYFTKKKILFAEMSSGNSLLIRYSNDTKDLYPDWDPEWGTDHMTTEAKEKIEKVTYGISLTDARPTSCKRWFQGLKNMTKIENTVYLNTSEVTSMLCMFYNCNSLTSIDLSNFNTEKVTEMKSMFFGCSALTSLDVSYLDTKNVRYMEYMFAFCSALPNLDLGTFNTEKVTNMSDMFSNCSSLKTINLSQFKTSNVTNMSYMFRLCTALTNLYIPFDMSKVTNTKLMFNGCSNLEKIKCDFDLSASTKLTDSESMFGGCTKLKGDKKTAYKDANPKDKTYAHPDHSTNQPGYFSPINYVYTLRMNLGGGDIALSYRYGKEYSSTNEDMEEYDPIAYPNAIRWGDYYDKVTIVQISNSMQDAPLTSLRGLFYGGYSSDHGELHYLSNLTTIQLLENLNTSKVKDMSSMFEGCSKLESVDLSTFDITNLEKTDYMFYDCKKLETIYSDTDWADSDKLTSSSNMFSGCKALKGGKGTPYNSMYLTKIYARRDEGITNPGYFTRKTPTDIENVQGDKVQGTKILRDGQIYILRGEKVYTITGQEVK